MFFEKDYPSSFMQDIRKLFFICINEISVNSWRIILVTEIHNKISNLNAIQIWSSKNTLFIQVIVFWVKPAHFKVSVGVEE